MGAGKTDVAVRSFHGTDGGSEHYILIQAPPDLDFAGQLYFVEDRYGAAQKDLGLGADSAVTRRFFLSDAINQAPAIYRSLLAETPDNPVALSVLQQAPLPGSKIALLAYHIDSPTPFRKTRRSPFHMMVEKNGNRHLWSTGLCAEAYDSVLSTEEQTRIGFGNIQKTLEDLNTSLRDHGVRIWVYEKDTDLLHAGMVVSRRELFTRLGMNGSSHYIASTAIQGAPAHRNGQISIDVYSQLDLHPEQLTYLYSDHIPARNNTIAFEYGAKIDYADRAHLFPSGTGSIDQSNAILHQGKLLPQLERSIENVESLLRAGGAELADMTHLIAYLRDPADEGKIRVALDERFPHLPTVVVHAPVCDPRWLVEIECAAIIPQRNSSPIGASKVSAFPRF